MPVQDPAQWLEGRQSKQGGVLVSQTITAAEYLAMVARGKDKPKASKYRNKKTVIDGRKFDSQAEANHYGQLLIQQAAGEVLCIVCQPEFVLPGGIKYRADFLVCHAGGRIEVVDVKGVLTKEYRLKKKLMAAAGYNIVEVRA